MVNTYVQARYNGREIDGWDMAIAGVGGAFRGTGYALRETLIKPAFENVSGKASQYLAKGIINGQVQRLKFASNQILGSAADYSRNNYSPYAASSAVSSLSYSSVPLYTPYLAYQPVVTSVSSFKAPVAQQMMYINQYGYLDKGAGYFSPMSNQFVNPGAYYNDIRQLAMNSARKILFGR